MKKFISFLFFAISIYGYGQNNLSFNRASIVDIPLGGTVTVPAGKVWKIESFGMSNSRVLYVPSLIIDGQNFTPSQNFNGPIWVNENSVIGRGVENGQASGAQKLSILEFTVSGSSGGGVIGGNVSSEGLTFSDILYEEIGTGNPLSGANQSIGTLTVPPNTIYKITSVGMADNPSGQRAGTVSFNYLSVNASEETCLYLGPGTYDVGYRNDSGGVVRKVGVSGLIYTY